MSAGIFYVRFSVLIEICFGFSNDFLCGFSVSYRPQRPPRPGPLLHPLIPPMSVVPVTTSADQKLDSKAISENVYGNVQLGTHAKIMDENVR